MIDSVLLTRPYSISRKEFPLGLLYVGTALKNRGYDVRIIDLHDNPLGETEIIDILSNSPNTLLGIGAHSPHYRWVKQFTLKLKEKSPHTLIIVGGHIAITWEILLARTGVDYVCLGEGEETLPELIEKINNGKSLKDVLGIVYKDGREVTKTGFRPLLRDFLIPDYSLIDINKYLIHPIQDHFFRNSPEYRAKEQKDDKLGMIMFSRGCMGGCNFCYRHLPGFRQGSIDWSFQHLRLLYEKFGIKYFRIDDELFINNLEWFNSLCQKFIDSKIDILFRVTGLRVDLIDDALLKKLKETGCIAINYGIESGSQKILDKMNKGTTAAQNLTAIKRTLSHGMQVMAYIMLGYEGENNKTLNETLSMLLESGLSRGYISLFYTIALPGTKLYRDCLAKGKIKNEEEYLEELAPYVEESESGHKRYIINLSEIKIASLIKWEKTLPILIKLNKVLKHYPLIFKTLRKIIMVIPANKMTLEVLSESLHLFNYFRKMIHKFNYNKKKVFYPHF